MKHKILFCVFFALATFSSFATKLVSVQIVDKDHIMLYFRDGDVTFNERAMSGWNLYYNDGENSGINARTMYGVALNTTTVATAGSWKISSTDDTNFGAAGISPTNVYRKSKLGCMAQMGWNMTDNDYNYDWAYEHSIFLKLPKSMVSGKTYTIQIPGNINSDVTTKTITFDIFNSRSEAVKVNIVGYSTANSIKSADVYLWMGDGGARDYTSFVGKKVYIYNTVTKESKQVGTLSLWRGKAAETGVGHQMLQTDVWNADFTGFNTAGKYRLAVEDIGCSDDFEIRSDIYYEPFKVSTQGFYYMRIGEDSQKSGISPVARLPLYIPGVAPTNCEVRITTMHPYHANWNSFVGGDKWDSPASWDSYKTGRTNPKAYGGHSDAKDWDRHLGHVSIIYDMLLPYYISGGKLSDDNLGIAESGNGIPDILDEARNEVDFWLRLRDGKGYSHGLTNPVSSSNPIFYQAGNTAVAAWANAANAAMLASCFRISGHTALMAAYRDSAVNAYNYANSLTDQMLTRSQDVGDATMTGNDFKITAAAFLYDVTGNTAYENDLLAGSRVTANNSQVFNGSSCEIYAVAGYLFTNRAKNNTTRYNNMKNSIVAEAKTKEANYTLSTDNNRRPSRRSTNNDAGWFITSIHNQRTIIAHAISAEGSADRTLFENALILEADFSLGRNPLNMINMTTATTGLATKKSVENAYTSGWNDGTPGVHPGHTPYMNAYDWGGLIMGRPKWMVDKNHPAVVYNNPSNPGNGISAGSWPIGELYYNTRYVYAANEFTPQQSMRGKTALYGYLYSLKEPQHVHDFSLWQITKAATCEAAGIRTEKCSLCGELGTKTEAIAKLTEHVWGAWSTWSVVTPATCEEKGSEKRTRSCTLNAAVIDTETRDIQAIGHTTPTGVWTSGNAATCTTASSRVEICARTGCTKIIASENKPALGHDFGNYQSDGNATCNADGTETATCSRCSVTDTRTKVGSQLPHNFVWTVTTAPTCDAGGEETQICSLCTEKGATRSIGKITEGCECKHTFSQWEVSKPATCIELGEETRTCSLCGEIDTRSIPKKEHDFEWKITTAASCETAGVESEVCTLCGAVNNTKPIAQLGHDFKNYTSNNDATCKADGTETGTCLRCGKTDTRTKVGSQLTHIFVWTETTAPTCDASGEETQICSLCAEKGATRSISKITEGCECKHVFDLWQETTKATCAAAGVETEQCSLCGVLGTKTRAVAQLTHIFGNWSIKTVATCAAVGEETRTCSLCGEIENRPIAKIAHDFSDWEITQNPTCGVAGSKTEKCTICGAEGEKTGVIPPTGEHTFVWKVNPDNDKEMIEVCSVCSEPSGAEPKPITCEHDFEWKVTTEATCEKAGEKTEICSKCPTTRDVEPIAKLPEHAYGDWSDWKIVESATCTTNGSQERTRSCTLNAAVIDTESEEIPATGHSYTSAVIAPTCEEEGYTTYTCVRGDHTYFADTVAELGHNWVWTTTTPATCDAEGEETQICSRCTEEGATRAIDKKTENCDCKHNYQAVVTAPTCTADGFTTHTCSICKDSYTDSKIPAAHTWGSERKVIEEASCTAAGYSAIVCSVCKAEKDKETIAQLEHKFENYTSDENAACTADGTETGTCSFCGKKDTRTEADSQLDHDFSDWKTTKEATCGEAGSKIEKCSVCGELGTTTAVIPATGEHTFVRIINPDNDKEKIEVCSVCGEPSGAEPQPIECTHVFNQWKVTTPAVCAAAGVETEQCSLCGVLGTKTRAVAQLTHIFGNWSVKTPATCAQAGEETRTCSLCGEVDSRSIAKTNIHTFGNWTVKTAATCATTGEETRTCSLCGEVEKQPIAKLEHIFGNYTSDGNATCTADGTETATCSLCGEKDTRTKTGSKLPHTFIWKVTTAATCEIAGVETEICSKCGASGTTRPVSALGHSFGNYVSDNNATCTADGTETRTCFRCGKTDARTKVGSKLAHTFGNWSVSKPVTCTEFGEETHTCLLCGKVESRETAKTAHHYEWKIDPNNPNQEIYACVDCGTDLGITRPIICDHDFVWTVTFTPTCQTSGWEQQICSKCNAKGAVRTISLDCKTYKVTVTNGTSNKTEYAAGEEVRIIANVEGRGNMFKQWSSLHVTFADAYEATTTFIMPAHNVTVTAVFETVGIDASTSSATEAVKVYPNPVRDELTINSGQLTINNVEITDLTGRIVLLPSCGGAGGGFDVSNLPQGVYIIKIYTNDSVIVRRFVKE